MANPKYDVMGALQAGVKPYEIKKYLEEQGFQEELKELAKAQAPPPARVDFSLAGGAGKTSGGQQDVMGIATPRQRVEAQGIASDIINSTTTLPATIAAGVQRGVGSLQTSLGYAPETQDLQPEYNADLGGYVEVDRTYSPFKSDPALMQQGMTNMTEADLVKAQIDKEKPVVGILGKAVREGGFQVGNMAPTLPLALVPGIGPDLALGAMSMGSGADAIKKGKEIGLTDTEIADYRGKMELPEFAGEKANFGTFMATLSGKNPFMKQVLKLAGTEFLSEAGTSHFQFAADKAYEKPGLTKEAREAIYNGIISGKSLSEDPALLKEYIAMQKETAIAVAGMTGLTGAAGKVHRTATGILANAVQQTDITTGVNLAAPNLPQVNPARTELQERLAKIMTGENDETAAARLAEIQAKKDKQAVQPDQGATNVEEVTSDNKGVPAAAGSETVSTERVPQVSETSPAVQGATKAGAAEVEAQAKNIQTFIDQIGETADPALQEVVTKAKEHLKALQPAEAKAETPKLDTAPTAGMYSDLGNMTTQGQQTQGKGDVLPIPGEDGKGGFKPIAKKKPADVPGAQTVSDAATPDKVAAPALPKLQKANIANHVGRLGSAEAVSKHYAKYEVNDPRRIHAEAVAAELYPGGEADGNVSAVQQEGSEGQTQVPDLRQQNVKFKVGDKVELKPGEPYKASGIVTAVSEDGYIQTDTSGSLSLHPDKFILKGGDTNGQVQGRDKKEIKGHVGKSGKAFTAKGTEIDFDYAVMEADDLVASHTADGSPNAGYPQEIQPRNREKATSQLQIKQISQKLRAPQLGENAKVSSGSPFVGPDGVVESGNGRTLGIRLAYDNNQAGEYRAWLHTVAKQYGIKESDVAKMKKPVFVRVRKTEVDRAEFAREANQAGMASMSPAELAKADAARLSDNDFAILNVGEDGNLLAASNREFVKSFLSKLGASEAAGLTDEAGKPTRQAADRMQAAIFANAYGDSKLISMAAEEADVDIKNILGAMNAAAPVFAKIEDRAAVKALTDAVGLVREAKSRSLTISDFLDQQDMFNDRDEAAEALARKIDAAKRSGKKLTELFKSLADTTKQNEDFASQDNLFGDKPKDTTEIAKAVTKAPASTNTIFTDEAAEKARALLRSKLNQLNSGIDPEILQAGITLAGWHIEKGARKFADFVKAMAGDMGEGIKPYLKSWYMGVKYDPRAAGFDGMDSAAVVDEADVDTISTKEAVTVNEPTLPEETPKHTFTVYRVGTKEGLENSNGGDAQGVAAFLADSDDYDNPTVAIKDGSFMYKYEVTSDGTFGEYDTYNNGKGGTSKAIGKSIKHGGEQYSFPADGFTYKLIGKIPMSEIYSDMSESDPDIKNFDDGGSIFGGESIVSSFEKRYGGGESTTQTEKAEYVYPDQREVLTEEKMLADIVPDDYMKMVAEAAQRPQTIDIQTAEREAKREAIAEELYGTGATNKKYRADLILGLAASGKSGVADPMAAEHGSLIIDSDMAKERLDEFDNGHGANAVHEESSDIFNRVLERAELAGDNIVLPLVGGSIKSLEKRLIELEKSGYEVHLHFVDLAMEKAVGRLLSRFENTGRLLDPRLITNNGIQPYINFGIVTSKGGIPNDTLDANQERGREANGQSLQSGVRDTGLEGRSGRSVSGQAHSEDGPAQGTEKPAYRVESATFYNNDKPFGSPNIVVFSRTNPTPKPPKQHISVQIRAIEVNPESWWKDLSAEDKSAILDEIGSTLKPTVGWKFVPKTVKEQILEVRSAQNVNSNNESAGSGSVPGAPGVAGTVTAADGNGVAGDVAGKQPDQVQETVPGTTDNTAVEGSGGTAGASSGPGSNTGVQASRPTRNYADVSSPSHVVGSARNFTITSLDFTGQGDKTKYKNNAAAIRLLKQLESEQRPATPEEQATLSRYVGWGGLPNAFNSSKKEWANEYQELKGLLTESEYEAARASTTDAHYTAAGVVNAIWSGVQRIGFDRGSVLEPSVGVGNFFGLMPREVRNLAKLTGVELDTITAGIARYLYPQAKIHNKGFQEIDIVPGSYDLAIGNPPFASRSIFDPKNKTLSSFNTHGYFFAKSIDSLRPGGVLAMVVSDSLMDNKQEKGLKQRAWMGERARLLGAIRLPNDAFRKNAGTDVTTDIIFLQKLAPGETGNLEAWHKIGTMKDAATGEDINVNQYFLDNPDMMLGEMTLSGKMYRGGAQALVSREGDNLDDLLKIAIAKLPAGVMSVVQSTDDVVTAARKGAPEKTGSVRLYNFFEENGKIYQRIPDINGEANYRDIEITGKTAERMAGMINLRDVLRQQLRIESDPTTTKDEMEANRDKLKTMYDSFVKSYGHLSSDVNKRLFWDDADSPLIRSLEPKFDKGLSKDLAKKQGKEERKPSADKAAIFSGRVIEPQASVTKVENATDALAASMNERGRVDFNYMSGIYGDKDQAAIVKELGDKVFEDPSAGWQTAAQYLSGNVKSKLAEAILAAKEDPRYIRNVEALDAVQPADVQAADIYVAPHSFWVPEEVYHQFAADIFKGEMKGGYIPATGKWNVTFTSSDPVANSSRYGTPRMDGTTIMSLLMANKQIVVKDRGATKDDPPVINKDETAAAQAKADELVELLQDWIWKDTDRRQKVVRFYNDTMNTNVEATFDGSHLTLPGKVNNEVFQFRPHQLNVIYRMLQNGVVLLDHAVGSGKTAIMTAAAMEMRRLGLAKKPMITVPNHLVEQWAASFAKLYPNAKILAATKKDFAKAKRQEMFAKIATGDWDVVIVAHSSFKFIPVPRETEIEILKEQEREFIEAYEAGKKEHGVTPTVKRLEDARKKITDKLASLADMPKDDLIDFKEMGVDALFVDEAHEFKNLFYTTTMQNVAGLGDPKGSGRAFDMFIKTQYLMRRNGDKGTYFATGTPVSNSLAEVYHMQRFLQYSELKARGINNFDAWASAFGKVASDWEQDAGGRFKQKSRFRSLVNLPELKGVWGTVADTVTNKQVMDDAISQGKPFWLPKMDGGKPKNVVVERSQEQARFIGIPKEITDDNGDIVYDKETGMPLYEYDRGTIVYRMDNWMAEKQKGNTREMPLVITGEARKAGLDYRLIDEDAPDFAGSKVNTAVNEIFDIYKENDYRKGTQLVFCDLSTPKSAKGKTMERLAETTPTYFIKANGTITHVPGKPVKLSALPDEEFFYYSKGTGKKRTVTIYEKLSGLSVGEGSSVDDAKNQASRRIENQGAEAITQRLRNLIIPAEQIDDYIARWEEQQAENDDSTEEDEAPESIISFDDILADSGKSNFSVYDDMRDKLIAKGMPAEQIAFIHDYNTDAQKKALFDQVNAGVIRVLFGSTSKMGAGTNVQKRLVGLHHMDAPWKPSDLAQREGRIVRQGNNFWRDTLPGGKPNPEHDPNFVVKIRRYATKQTYDSRMWEINEIKATSIEQFRTGGKDVREIEDVSSESANAAEIKASSAGNPLMLEDLQLKKEVQRLSGMEKSWRRGRYDLEDTVRSAENKDTFSHRRLAELERTQDAIQQKDPEAIGLKIGSISYDGDKDMKPEARNSLYNKIGTEIKRVYLVAQERSGLSRKEPLGSYRGMTLKMDGYSQTSMAIDVVSPDGTSLGFTTYAADDKFTLSGFVRRLDNILDKVPANIEAMKENIVAIEKQAESAREELKQPFKYAQQLKEAKEKHAKVITALRAGKKSLAEVGEPVGNPYEKFAANPYDGFILDSLGLQQIYERLASTKIIKEAMTDLRALGAHIYAKGQTTWKEWFVGMKEALGKLFGKYRGPLENVYKFTSEKMKENRGSLGDMFRGNTSDTSPVTSVDPEIEKRWQGAKGFGSTTKGIKERIGEFVDDVLAETQHFSKLDLSDRVGKRTSNILRVFESAGAAAKAKTVNHLQGLVKDFDNGQMDVFTRAVILGDLMNEAAKGHKLPFGYDPITLVTDYQNVMAAVNQDSQIQAALERRKEVNKEMVLQLVDAGLLPVESVLKESAKAHYQQTGNYDEADINTDYYRHQVLAHAAAKQWAGVSTAGDVRNKKRGWMKERQGSELDINTNFLEAEFEWFSQSMKELATKKVLDEVLSLNDITAELKAEADAQGIDDWKTLIPEDYVAWQPVKGSVFYRGQTLPEAVVNKFIETNPAFADVADMFRSAMILGGKKHEAIIPIGLAETLDNLRVDREDALLDTVNKKLIGAWKINTLLNPHRVIKYNINNMSGDMDAAMAADPAILKYMWPAFRNAVARKNGRALTQMEIDMVDRGVIDAGISINEIPDISKLPGFKNVSETARNTRVWESMKSGNLTAILPPNLIAQYFDFVSGWTQVREGILREAAYMRALDLMRQGNTVYWASDAMELNSIPDMKDKAAKLSRELLGDYGNLSAHGEKLRTRFIPFWSWMEINAPRYYRIFKNAAMRGEGGSTTARLAGVGGRKVIGGALGIAEKVLLAQALFALVSLFNRLVWPEEEEALGENGRKQLHIILGKTSDGKVLTVRFQGAFSDVLGWMGLEDYPSMIRRYAEGKMDKADVWQKMWQAPFNKLANASVPFVKLAGELITQKSIYPDITKPVPVRDRKEHIARFFSFDEEYRTLAGKPSKGYAEGFKKSLVYESDPGEQAYNTIRQLAYKYQGKHGKEKPSSTPTEQANALYYYRQAIKYGDEVAKKKYMQQYLDAGGKRSGLSESINRAAPLASLPTNLKFKFRSSLSAADQETLKKANEWYRETYKK